MGGAGRVTFSGYWRLWMARILGAGSECYFTHLLGWTSFSLSPFPPPLPFLFRRIWRWRYREFPRWSWAISLLLWQMLIKHQSARLFLPTYSFLQQSNRRKEEGTIKGISVQRKNWMIPISVGSSFCFLGSVIIFPSWFLPEAPEPQIVFPFSRFTCCMESSRGAL